MLRALLGSGKTRYCELTVEPSAPWPAFQLRNRARSCPARRPVGLIREYPSRYDDRVIARPNKCSKAPSGSMLSSSSTTFSTRKSCDAPRRIVSQNALSSFRRPKDSSREVQTQMKRKVALWSDVALLNRREGSRTRAGVVTRRSLASRPRLLPVSIAHTRSWM